MSEPKKKKKMLIRDQKKALEIIEKVIDYNKDAQINFQLVLKVDKGKSDRSIPKWVQVSEDRLNFIKLKII